MVYDITRYDSFEQLRDFWVGQLKDNAPKNLILAIAANKSDLIGEEKVDEGEARKFADSIGAIFRLTSAKQQNGVEDLFRDVGTKFLDPSYDGVREKRKSVKTQKIEEPIQKAPVKKKGCC